MHEDGRSRAPVSDDRAARGAIAAEARYKLICCKVFRREMAAAISASPNLVDPEFLELGLHERPDELRARLQERIDAIEPSAERYDAILLGYGLCGNGTAGLRARGVPLVLPRAHDCCTILLGSRAAFLESFGSALSASWSSAGNIDRASAERRRLWDILSPETVEKELRFIEMPETEGLGCAELMRAKAAEEGRAFVLLRGDSRLLRALLAGAWDEEEFLVVPPGKSIVGLYDHERIIAAE